MEDLNFLKINSNLNFLKTEVAIHFLKSWIGWKQTLINNTPFKVDYTVDATEKNCEDLDCEEKQACFCSDCVCCSICSAQCECPVAVRDPDQKMAQILGFGDTNYWFA